MHLPFCACIHFFGRNGWCRSHTKVGSSADECEGVKHSSCKESPAGEEKGILVGQPPQQSLWRMHAERWGCFHVMMFVALD